MKKVPVLPSVFMALLFFAAHAHAAPLDSGDLLNNILHKYADVASTWQNKMVSYANWLFWGLVLISMVWTFGMMALKNAGLTEALAELVRFFTVTGFFWWILSNGPAMSMSIIDSMRMMASNASGVGNSLCPASRKQRCRPGGSYFAFARDGSFFSHRFILVFALLLGLTKSLGSMDQLGRGDTKCSR